MYTTSLKSMPYAQASVIDDQRGNVYLRSYSTIVCQISGDWFYCNGLYSATTRRHISAFCREYGRGVVSYATARDVCVRDGYAVNMETGEVKPWEEVEVEDRSA